MRVAYVLGRLGGVADCATLTKMTSRAKLDAAVRAGEVVRDSRGRYALPTADDALRACEDGLTARPDLVDEKLRLVVEAESFEWHGRRKALKKHCERYNALVLRGWVVIRFSWEHVMFEPEYGAACLRGVVEILSAKRAVPRRSRRIPA